MSRPRLSISECTTFGATFEVDVQAYAAAGLDGIGIWEFKLRGADDGRAIAAIEEAGLGVSICVPEVPSIYPDGYFTEPSTPRARTDALAAAARRFAPFHPAAILVVLGDPAGRDRVQMRRDTVDGLQEVAEVAGELGLVLGLEAYRQASGSLLTSIPDQLELLDEIDRPNVKIVADTWHLWDQPGVIDQFRTAAGRFVGVQICDYRDPTRSWADRVMPGDGVIDFPALFGALEAGGYDGWYDLEIFSDDGRFGNAWPDSIWARNPLDVARDARRGFDDLWDGRRRPTG